MKTTAFSVLLLLNSLPGKALDLSYRGIFHSEFEKTYAASGRTEDENFYSVWYSHMQLDHDISDAWFVSLDGKANAMVAESAYETPMYLRGKSTSGEIERALLSEASLNFDNTLLGFSLGRQEVNYDWLNGSIDGVSAMAGSDERLSLRLLWFKRFSTLQYNYFTDVHDINEGDGLYGAIAKGREGAFELSLYDYHMQSLRNLYGGHLSYLGDHAGFNLSYAGADALGDALYTYDESFLNASAEMLYGNHFIELGASRTGENGLIAMIQMGSFKLGQFYLGNQVDRENAKNGFARYIYADETWRVELIGGATRYDNRFEQRIDNLDAYEADLYVQYRFNRRYGVDFGAMHMNVDQRDPLQSDQTLVMFNLVYDYENH